MDSYDKKVIEMYCKNSKVTNAFLDVLTSPIGVKTQCTTHVIPSKYKIINWLRRLFRCEKKKHNYTFEYTAPPPPVQMKIINYD